MNLLIIENLLIKEKNKIPVYEYTCIECDQEVEITRGFSDEESIPYCSSGHLMKRSYSTFGIQFKGDGFYSTGG
jgi:putative FmdB family regulatory protein